MKNFFEQKNILEKMLSGDGKLKPRKIDIARFLDVSKQNFRHYEIEENFPYEIIVNFCLKHNIIIDSFYRDNFPLRYIDDCQKWENMHHPRIGSLPGIQV